MDFRALLLLLILAFLSSSEAARKVNVQERMAKSKRDVPIGITRTARDLVGLTSGEDLKEGRHISTPHGHEKIKYQETYKGVPVEGATVVMEKDSRGHFTGVASGHLVKDLDEDLGGLEPEFDEAEAMRILARKNRDRLSDVGFNAGTDAKLEIMVKDSFSETVSAKLVYRVSYLILNENRQSRPTGIVDAVTGDVISFWEGLTGRNRPDEHSKIAGKELRVNGIGGNVKIGKMLFDGGKLSKLLVTYLGDGQCTMKNPMAAVYNCNFSWKCVNETEHTFQFPCDNVFNDEINGAYSPLSDSLFGITITYEMFDQWYGIQDPLFQENSQGCFARAHFGVKFQNAFWDGTFITLGDGADEYFAFTGIDDIAHEISHGITEFNSGLEYYGESGGMNEAFSDIAGEAAKYFVRNFTDYMTSYDTRKDPDKAMRYFEDPTKDGHSVGHQDEYCPGLNVHYSSGIFNRAFFLLATSKGWNPRTAFHVFVVANELYWTPHSTFYEGACGVVQAAKDLEMDAEAVRDAFRKVGVEPCVDTRKGLNALADLNVPAGHTAVFHFELKDNFEAFTVSVEMQSGHVALHTPTGDHCALAKSDMKEFTSIDVCSPEAGLYMLEITPEKDMVRGRVIITEKSQVLFSDILLMKNSSKAASTFNGTVQITKEMTKDSSVLFSMVMEHGFAYAIFMKEGEIKFYLVPVRPQVMCKIETGLYHIGFRHHGDEPALVSELTMTVMHGAKRVDARPNVTRAPVPTQNPEGSGEE